MTQHRTSLPRLTVAALAAALVAAGCGGPDTSHKPGRNTRHNDAGYNDTARFYDDAGRRLDTGEDDRTCD